MAINEQTKNEIDRLVSQYTHGEALLPDVGYGIAERVTLDNIDLVVKLLPNRLREYLLSTGRAIYQGEPPWQLGHAYGTQFFGDIKRSAISLPGMAQQALKEWYLSQQSQNDCRSPGSQDDRDDGGASLGKGR